MLPVQATRNPNHEPNMSAASDSAHAAVTQLLIDLCGALGASEADTTGLSGEELAAAEAHNRDILGLLDAITKYHIKIIEERRPAEAEHSA